jgi:uncharacterized protein YktB (UPF0637 family)
MSSQNMKRAMAQFRQSNLRAELTRLKRLEDDHVKDVKKIQKNIATAQQTIKNVVGRLKKIKTKEQQVKRLLKAKQNAENRISNILNKVAR